MATHQPERADHDLGGGFHVLVAGVYEEVRVEQHPQHWAHIELRVPERSHQGVDRLLVARRLERPSGHLRLVGDEEVVQVSADKASARRLLYNDVDDVFAVEVPLMTEELLLAIVMIFGPVL